MRPQIDILTRETLSKLMRHFELTEDQALDLARKVHPGIQFQEECEADYHVCATDRRTPDDREQPCCFCGVTCYVSDRSGAAKILCAPCFAVGKHLTAPEEA